jgi:hypothetical protein
MTDLDIGMNQRLCEPFKWDDSARLRPRQGDDRRGAGGRQGLRPLQGRGRRRHSLAHLPRHAPDQGQLLHPRHHARPYARYSERGPTTSTTCERLLRKFAPPPPWCRSPVLRRARSPTAGRDLLRLHQPGDARGAGRAGRRRASTWTPCACAPSRSRRGREFIAAHDDQVFVVEQNRDAQMRTCWSTSWTSTRRAGQGAALRRHADHRALHHPGDHHAAFNPRAQTLQPRPAKKEPHDLHRQTQAAPPHAARPNKVGYTRRDYEGKHLHPVRRLRARLDLGGHHPGLLGAGHRAAPRRQALGHRLQSKTPDYFLGAARLQHRARPHAQRC